MTRIQALVGMQRLLVAGNLTHTLNQAINLMWGLQVTTAEPHAGVLMGFRAQWRRTQNLHLLFCSVTEASNILQGFKILHTFLQYYKIT
jgi:hypothetical protein